MYRPDLSDDASEFDVAFRGFLRAVYTHQDGALPLRVWPMGDLEEFESVAACLLSCEAHAKDSHLSRFRETVAVEIRERLEAETNLDVLDGAALAA
jgi:hypothetical protein